MVGSPAGAAELDEGSLLIVALYSWSCRHERTILHWRSESSDAAGHGWSRSDRRRVCWDHDLLRQQRIQDRMNDDGCWRRHVVRVSPAVASGAGAAAGALGQPPREVLGPGTRGGPEQARINLKSDAGNPAMHAGLTGAWAPKFPPRRIRQASTTTIRPLGMPRLHRLAAPK